MKDLQELAEWFNVRNEMWRFAAVPYMRSQCRARAWMLAAGAMFPDAWRVTSLALGGRGTKWPEWCWLPSQLVPPERTEEEKMDPHRLLMLATWRMTQGVYCFDATLYEALRETPLDGEIPSQMLLRLPEWAVYIATPGMTLDGARIYGVWARNDYRKGSDVPHELHLLLDGDGALQLQYIALPLAGTLQESLLAMMGDPETYDEEVLDYTTNAFDVIVRPVISMLLYLCSDRRDMMRAGKEAAPAPLQFKPGAAPKAPGAVKQWDVGVRIGAALRMAQERAEKDADELPNPPTGRRMKPHVRRGHWHTYWSGPRKRDDGSPIPKHEQSPNVRWVPPIPVNVGAYDELPTTIYPVKA